MSSPMAASRAGGGGLPASEFLSLLTLISSKNRMVFSVVAGSTRRRTATPRIDSGPHLFFEPAKGSMSRGKKLGPGSAQVLGDQRVRRRRIALALEQGA